MESEFYQGIWEEVARDHGQDLRGHRVEIRIIDGGLKAVLR
jgi:hypothetical protein